MNITDQKTDEWAHIVERILPEEQLEAVNLARIACRPLFQWQELDDA